MCGERTMKKAAAMPQTKNININHAYQRLTSFHTFQTKQEQIWDKSHGKREARETPGRTEREPR